MFALFWERPQTPAVIDLLSISALFCVDYTAARKLDGFGCWVALNSQRYGR